MDVFHRLGGFTQGQAQIDPVGEAKGHDISVVFAEFQRGCILRQGGDIHLEEIYRELTVDVVQLIFILAIIQIGLIHFFQVVKVVGAFWVHAFMDDEMFTILLTGQRMGTVRTLERKDPGKTVLIGRE